MTNPIRFLRRWPGVIQTNYSLLVLWDGVKKSGCSSGTADWVLVLVPTSPGMALVIPSPRKLKIWVDTSFSHYLPQCLHEAPPESLSSHGSGHRDGPRCQLGTGLRPAFLSRAVVLGTPRRNKIVLSRSYPRINLKCKSAEALPRPLCACAWKRTFSGFKTLMFCCEGWAVGASRPRCGQSDHRA